MSSRKAKGDRTDDYEVGFGRPPKQHQIKPGEKRNPFGCKGKPKPAVDFLDELMPPMPINGKMRRLTRDQLLDHMLFKEANDGNVSAIDKLEKRYRARQAGAATAVQNQEVSSAQRGAFERSLKRYRDRERQETGDCEGASDGLEADHG